ncbi:MAG: cbb3-type cytochrome c oxidase subunit I [Acidimicrobiales bacterium]
MALTETRPETDAPAAAEQAATTTLDGLLGSADHKTIGRFWIAAGLFTAVAALVVSVVASFEATDLGSFAVVEDGQQFTQIWSLGRELLLFGAIVPILVGLATFLVPLQIGAPSVAFARGAAGAFWTWFAATDLFILSYLLNGGPGGGREDFVVLWAASLGVMLAAILWALIIIATTILGARTVGMSLDRVPNATWSFLVFSLIGLVALPVILTELVMVYIAVRHGQLPLEARDGLIGVLTPSNIPPSLYWVAVPLLGMSADMIGVHTGRPVRMHKPVLVAIGLLGILAYGMHYFGFASVRPLVFDNGLLVVTIAAAILPILAVLGLAGDSVRNGSPKLTTPLAGALVSGLLLLLGAAVSLLGLIEPIALFLHRETAIDIDLDRLLILNGTTFHDGIRGLVLGAVLVAIIGALHHWAPKLFGRRMAESLGMGAVLATAAGAVVWGAGAVLAGVDDQPAYPVSTLGGGENVEFFNVVATVGILLVAVGVAITGLNVIQAAFGRGQAQNGRNGWTGSTLEWATASPPTFGNFDKPPIVRSATPLADTIDAIDESEVILDDAARAEGSAETEEGASA